jgi:hypothetical protein
MKRKRQKATLTITETGKMKLNFKWEFDPPIDPKDETPTLLGGVMSAIAKAIDSMGDGDDQ